VANADALWFLLVLLGRPELFTEHPTLAVVPVLAGEASLARPGRVWGVVYLDNVVRGLCAGIVVLIAPALGIAEPRAFVEIAEGPTDHRWPVVLAAGVLSGGPMGLLPWPVAAARRSVSRLPFVRPAATAIGFAHPPHGIAGTVEVLLGVFVPRGHPRRLRPVPRGGHGRQRGRGSVFASLLKHGHVVRGGPGIDRYGRP
jgi:formate/nitrite transporter FocA (FNT family)